MTVWRARARGSSTADITGQIVQLDQSVRLWVVLHRIAALNPVLWGASVVGRGGIVWLAIGVTLAATHRLRPWALIELALAILLATLLADHLLKPIVARERPFTSTPDSPVIGGRPQDASFPSGHTANAFAGAFVLSRVVPSTRIGWWAMAAVIAYSRIYLGVHYPLDVLAGALIGCACGAMAGRLIARATMTNATRSRGES